MQDQFDEITLTYLDDLKHDLGDIETLILQIDKIHGDENRRKLARILHSVKGTAGSFGLAHISSAAHRMEDILAQMKLVSRPLEDVIDALMHERDLMEKLLIAYRKHDSLTLEALTEKFSGQHLTHPQKNAPLPGKKISNPRILIIEDSKIVINLILTEFNKYEVTCSVSQDGYNALGRILQEKFDFIISKHHVALIDGPSLEKIVRQVPNQNKETPFLIVSSQKNETPQTQKPSLTVFMMKTPDLAKEILQTFSSRIAVPLVPKKDPRIEKPIESLKKILAIDDSPEILSLIALGLKKYPIELRSLSNPNQAVSTAKEFKPDLILLDVQMPQLDGPAVLKNLKKEGIEAKIFYLTGTSSPDELAELKKTGVNNIISKPFSPKTFCSLIQEKFLSA